VVLCASREMKALTMGSRVCNCVLLLVMQENFFLSYLGINYAYKASAPPSMLCMYDDSA
jgi:hypothetical protein